MIRINKFLESIRPLAREKGATLSQLVIAWTLLQPGITVALVGARTREQVQQNAGAIEVQLSADEVGMINSELDKLNLDLE